jgi:hypothetical protein
VHGCSSYVDSSTHEPEQGSERLELAIPSRVLRAGLAIEGNAMRQKAKVENYDAPAGGWGSLKAVASILTQEEVAILGSEILLKQNKPDGFMCVSCSWAKPAKPRPFEFCENGAKATAWEITRKTVTPEFFAQHTLAELRTWSDHQLEEQGRLTTPMRYDRASDKYLPVDWEEAFAAIGAELNRLDPRSVVMYTSGRASLETSYMYQLFGRMYGTNNFPDSSNMCHETTSVALPEVIGVPVGTVLLEDFDGIPASSHAFAPRSPAPLFAMHSQLPESFCWAWIRLEAHSQQGKFQGAACAKTDWSVLRWYSRPYSRLGNRDPARR